MADLSVVLVRYGTQDDSATTGSALGQTDVTDELCMPPAVKSIQCDAST